jgi:hypothetical protein
VKAEVEYTALVSVEVDLETGEVASVGIHPTRDEDETPSQVSVSLESETEQPDAVFDRAQQLVDAAAPFELRGSRDDATVGTSRRPFDRRRCRRGGRAGEAATATGEGGWEAASVRDRVHGRASRVAL